MDFLKNLRKYAGWNTSFAALVCVIMYSSTLCAQSPEVWREKQAIDLLLSNEEYLDSLVDHAFENSYYLMSYAAELEQQDENVKQEKNKWLSTFRLGINFFSISTTSSGNDQSVTTAGLLPNIGLNLGIDPEKFINRASYIREAQAGVVRTNAQLMHQKRLLRDEIVRLYYQYLEALGILGLRIEANDVQREQCQLTEERFKKGEVQIETVLLNQSAYVLTKESLLRSQLSVDQLRRRIRIISGDSENHIKSLSGK